VGASYPVAAIAESDRLYAVRACCRLPRAEIIYEFGYMDLSAAGRPFVPLLELTETGTEEPITLVSMQALIPPALGNPQRWTEGDQAADGDAWLLSDGYTVTYVFRDEAQWLIADHRLEHPGRASYDGFSEAHLTEAEPEGSTEAVSPSGFSI
jgi:hypothetical protein